ncbi:MAG: hypothetical protein AB7V26_14555 [Lysobacterales bacterium]
MNRPVDPSQRERVIADQAELRRLARAKSWPEKIAAIERLRDSARLARAAMRRALAAGQADGRGSKV